MLGVAIYFGKFGCDETCGREPGWRGDADAWQWHAQFVLALLAVGAALVGAALLFRADARPGVRLFIAGVALAAIWTVWMF